MAQVLKDQETIDQMRKCFLVLSYHHGKTMAEFTIPATVAEHAQSLFVNKRQKEASEDNLQTDDQKFHRWLTLARYLSLMDGQIELSEVCFDRAVALEQSRLSRCPIVAKPT